MSGERIETLGAHLPRYDMVYDRSLHQYTMLIADAPEAGEWVKLEDVRAYVMPFISGYLDTHAHMLKDQGVHSKIVAAVNHLKKMVDEL